MNLKLKSLVLFTALFSVFSASAQALTIRFYTKVSGYNKGDWIEIVDGAPKAKPANVNGQWITDRVERGANILIKIADSNGKRCNWDVDNLVITVNGKKAGSGVVVVPTDLKGEVPTSVNADNVVIRLKSLIDGEQASRRIPIGTR